MGRGEVSPTHCENGATLLFHSIHFPDSRVDSLEKHTFMTSCLKEASLGVTGNTMHSGRYERGYWTDLELWGGKKMRLWSCGRCAGTGRWFAVLTPMSAGSARVLLADRSCPSLLSQREVLSLDCPSNSNSQNPEVKHSNPYHFPISNHINIRENLHIWLYMSSDNGFRWR